MLRVAILDANERATKDEHFIDGVNSVVGNWLTWEVQQSDIPLSSAAEADVLLLVHAGQVDWRRSVQRELRRVGITHNRLKRGGQPYIIAGGAIDANPYTWQHVADACAVGEAYLLVRGLLDMVRDEATIPDIDQWLYEYDHALTATQLEDIPRDNDRPWRLARLTEPVAQPDDYVDWDANPMIRSSDKVTRVIAAKGCHLKCKFCATTYRQSYKVNPNEGEILRGVKKMGDRGERLGLITNDVAALPFFKEIPKHGPLDSQSLTLKAIRDDDTLRALVKSDMKIARFGVEGISERIRHAFGKPIPNDELVERVGYLQDHGINTHMFYIVGSPFEDKDDWDELKQFYAKLARRVRKGICRIKMTAFEPNAPTPLGYFVSGTSYYEHMQEFMQWVADNWASRHLFVIKGRKPDSRMQDLADLFGLTKKQVHHMATSQGTTDLAPTVEDAYHMPWEVVSWPLPTAKRWHLAQSYKKYMGVMPRAKA